MATAQTVMETFASPEIQSLISEFRVYVIIAVFTVFLGTLLIYIRLLKMDKKLKSIKENIEIKND